MTDLTISSTKQGATTKELFNWFPEYWLIIGLFFSYVGQFDYIPQNGLARWKELTSGLVAILALIQLVVFVWSIRHVVTQLRNGYMANVIRYGVVPLANIVVLAATVATLSNNLSEEAFQSAWYGTGKWLLAYFASVTAYESLDLRKMHLWGKEHEAEFKTTLLTFMILIIPAMLFNQFFGNLSSFFCSNCPQIWLSASDLPGIVLLSSITFIISMMAVGGIRCLLTIQDSAFVR